MIAKLYKIKKRGQSQLLTTIVDVSSCNRNFPQNNEIHPNGKFAVIFFCEDEEKFKLEIPEKEIDNLIAALQRSKEWLNKS